ncbi:MAG TPA: FtsX-like permease family protein, partial [Longimicrobiales bacterium]|nr:FtsX-like permease family protein [Longimicrobiales bacterium]
DVRHEGPDTEPYPKLYWEHRQFSPFNLMSLVVRTEQAAATSVVPGIRAELAELDPGIPLYNVHPMAELFADAIRRSRLVTISLGGFALVALLLAAIGIYGVVAHATARRTREIGIRMALGADRPTILGMVLRDGMGQVVIAIAVGTGGALALSRILEGLVFDVSTADPLTFLATVGLLGTIGFVASWLPARRASGIDPAETIRSE